MNNRHPRRWCDDCKLMVFALDHKHMQLGDVPSKNALVASAIQESCVVRHGFVEGRVLAELYLGLYPKITFTYDFAKKP